MALEAKALADSLNRIFTRMEKGDKDDAYFADELAIALTAWYNKAEVSVPAYTGTAPAPNVIISGETKGSPDTRPQHIVRLFENACSFMHKEQGNDYLATAFGLAARTLLSLPMTHSVKPGAQSQPPGPVPPVPWSGDATVIIPGAASVQGGIADYLSSVFKSMIDKEEGGNRCVADEAAKIMTRSIKGQDAAGSLLPPNTGVGIGSIS